jgi:hypothetical protein
MARFGLRVGVRRGEVEMRLRVGGIEVFALPLLLVHLFLPVATKGGDVTVGMNISETDWFLHQALYNATQDGRDLDEAGMEAMKGAQLEVPAYVASLRRLADVGFIEIDSLTSGEGVVVYVSINRLTGQGVAWAESKRQGRR